MNGMVVTKLAGRHVYPAAVSWIGSRAAEHVLSPCTVQAHKGS